ncbi:MAG: beta/gamma crystallin-related protein [Betaproteobacteria bacterium]
MTPKLKAMLVVAGTIVATQAAAQVTFYEGEHFRGGTFRAEQAVGNFDRIGFNDRASSAIVEGGSWEVCEDAGFQGRCTVLQPGDYSSLGPMGLNNRISSARPVSDNVRYPNEVPPPPPVAVYEYRRVPGERLFEVPVSSVRAVVGPPEQRCWVERQQVVEPSQPNVPGAIVGAIIGGVLGHQVGGGRGQDVATAGGAVVGGAIGANAGRGGSAVYGQDVQRCEAVPGSSRAEYWDVVYHFRGIQHRVQMSAAPGPTIWVNGAGEPRG